MSNIIPFPRREQAPTKHTRKSELVGYMHALIQAHCNVGYCFHWLDLGDRVCTGCRENKNEQPTGGPDNAA